MVIMVNFWVQPLLQTHQTLRMVDACYAGLVSRHQCLTVQHSDCQQAAKSKQVRMFWGVKEAAYLVKVRHVIVDQREAVRINMLMCKLIEHEVRTWWFPQRLRCSSEWSTCTEEPNLSAVKSWHLKQNLTFTNYTLCIITRSNVLLICSWKSANRNKYYVRNVKVSPEAWKWIYANCFS